MLPRRTLGPAALSVSAIGLGTFPFAGSYGDMSEAASLTVIRAALDQGVTLLDTGDNYGASELLVGKAIRGHRDDVQLATKFGAVAAGSGGARQEWAYRGDAAYVAQACETSLRRLGVDHLDLYYLHRVDPDTPIEETVGAMAGLVADGKVRHLGLCEVGPQTLRRAAAVHPIAALQSEWSIWARRIETTVVPTARELGIGLVPFSPLGRGFLAGTIAGSADLGARDVRRLLPRFEAANLEQNLRLVAELRRLAGEKHCTAAQLALAWLLAQGDDVVPIPGADRPSYVRDNAASAEIELTADDLRRIDAFAPVSGATVAGARAAPAQAAYEPGDGD